MKLMFWTLVVLFQPDSIHEYEYWDWLQFFNVVEWCFPVLCPLMSFFGCVKATNPFVIWHSWRNFQLDSLFVNVISSQFFFDDFHNMKYCSSQKYKEEYNVMGKSDFLSISWQIRVQCIFWINILLAVRQMGTAKSAADLVNINESGQRWWYS